MKAAEEPKTCMMCKNSVSIDYGYSNYTVEGTTFYCGKKAHPADGFDEFYGEDKRLKFAEECSSFQAGEGLWIDVDGEQEEGLSEDQRQLLKNCER